MLYHSFWGTGKVIKAKLTEYYYSVMMQISATKVLEFRILENLDKVEKDCKPGATIHFNAQLSGDWAVMDEWNTEEEYKAKLKEYAKDIEK